MADHPGWYPPGQVCYPPELPTHFKNVPDLKPIVGVPSDDEVIRIHTVLHAANRVSGVPGMHDPNFFMRLADHLFSVQMARYRSGYSLITFPSDATYTPPTLPAHISINLELVSGAPSDDQITKVQDAVQTYQELKRIPSMFDARINMELSQHLFDLQMARHMRTAGEIQSSPMPGNQATSGPEGRAQATEYTPNTNPEPAAATNNVGTGAAAGIRLISQSLPSIDVRELMERSNQLAERFNHLLERSNELVERCSQSKDQPSSPALAERFNDFLERFTQLIEQSHQPKSRSDSLTERFNQLFERFNQLIEQSNHPVQKANKLAERSNELADKANQLAENLNQYFERSNQLTEQANKPVEKLGELLKNISRVLNHKGNTINAIDSLVNDKGEMPVLMDPENWSDTRWLSKTYANTLATRMPVVVDGVSHECHIPDAWLGKFLQFYGICEELRESATSRALKKGKKQVARSRLSDYLSSCLG